MLSDLSGEVDGRKRLLSKYTILDSALLWVIKYMQCIDAQVIIFTIDSPRMSHQAHPLYAPAPFIFQGYELKSQLPV